jgi:hypothetical protein
MVIIFALILIQFVYAGTVRISPPTSTPSQNFTVNVNSTCCFNINNSDLLDGFDSSYFYPYSNPYNFINTTSDSWSTNYTSYYNKTQLDNGTWIKNNTSPTFVNVTATTGILSLLYDLAGILTIDVNNHLLYDLASVLSLDFNDRVLYASDGTDKILDWYNVGIADFGNTNITTTGNVSSSHYCNSTNCYTVNDFLIDTTGGTDSWAGNYTLYYNKTLIDHNFTFYYLKTDIDNNFTLYLPLTGGVLSGNLTLPSINLTTNYVCNSTNCYTINDFLMQSAGASYNVTYANYVIANISNMSYYWNNLASSSDIVIGDLTPSNLDLTGYALAVTYINGSFGVLNLKAEDWVLEGVDLIINQDLYIGGTLYPNATLSRDIGSGALRWNILWVSNISSENIDNSGKITSGTYCNSTGTCRDLSAWGSEVDLSLYYLKTEIDNNFSLYYTKTESNANLNNNITSINSNINNNFTASKTYTNGVIAGNLTLTLLKNGTTIATGNFNFGGYNISNIDNITVNKYCNSTKCYTLNDLLTTSSSTDSWSLNYSFYYNSTQVNNIVSSNDTWRTNYTAYYTGANVNSILGSNLSLTLLVNGSRIVTGNMNFGGFNVSNIDNLTSNKICNSTKCYLLSDFLSTTGDGSFNTTYHNYVTANYSNNSLFWQGHTGTDGSWLTGLPSYNSSYVPYTGATSDVDLGSNQLYFGSYPSVYGLTEHEFRIQVSDGSLFSFLDYGGNLIITGDSGGNDVNLGSITYPFTRAIFDTLTISGANITDSTGAITFDNENLTTSSYGFFGWLGSLTNRITKAWFTNLDLNGTIQMNQGNITNATYIIMNEKSGACDLTINHSICSNSSGTFLIGIIMPLL